MFSSRPPFPTDCKLSLLNTSLHFITTQHLVTPHLSTQPGTHSIYTVYIFTYTLSTPPHQSTTTHTHTHYFNKPRVDATTSVYHHRNRPSPATTRPPTCDHICKPNQAVHFVQSHPMFIVLHQVLGGQAPGICWSTVDKRVQCCQICISF